MKQIISFITVSASALAILCSCSVKEEPVKADISLGNTTYFDGIISDDDTKGLMLVAQTNWNKTSETNIHLYQNGEEGANPTITVDEKDPRIAHFTADFSEIQAVSAPITKSNDTYEYNAVIAKTTEAGTFMIPCEQFPDFDVAKIDKDSDCLIGRTKQTSKQYSSTEPVNLDFVRPVSMSRLAIVNVGEGETVEKVVITADQPLTGSFTKNAVDFNTGEVDFDTDGAPNTITLSYSEESGTPESSIIFYAYFVSIPVEATITSIEVTTDNTIYTLTKSASFNFTTKSFNSIAVDLKKAATKPAKTTKFYLVDELADGEEGIIVSDDYALKNDNGSLASYDISKLIDEDDDTIEIPGDDVSSVTWSISKPDMSSSYGTYVISNGGKSIYRSNSSLKFGSTPTDYTDYYVWDYTGYQITNKTYRLYYSNGKFTVSTSANTTKFYSKTKPAEPKYYELVTDKDDVTTGKYLLVVYNKKTSSVSWSFFNKTADNYKFTATELIIDNKKVKASATVDACAVDITKDGDNYRIKAGGEYMYVNSSKAIAFTSSSDDKTNHTLAIDSEDGSCDLCNTGDYSETCYFDYGGSSTYKFCYVTSDDRTSSTKILLFKYTGTEE